MGYFSAKVGQNRVTFYSNIRSHWGTFGHKKEKLDYFLFQHQITLGYFWAQVGENGLLFITTSDHIVLLVNMSDCLGIYTNSR